MITNKYFKSSHLFILLSCKNTINFIYNNIQNERINR